jgi:flagellar biosynthesis protein FlhB
MGHRFHQVQGLGLLSMHGRDICRSSFLGIYMINCQCIIQKKKSNFFKNVLQSHTLGLIILMSSLITSPKLFNSINFTISSWICWKMEASISCISEKFVWFSDRIALFFVFFFQRRSSKSKLKMDNNF